MADIQAGQASPDPANDLPELAESWRQRAAGAMTGDEAAAAGAFIVAADELDQFVRRATAAAAATDPGRDRVQFARARVVATLATWYGPMVPADTIEQASQLLAELVEVGESFDVRGLDWDAVIDLPAACLHVARIAARRESERAK